MSTPGEGGRVGTSPAGGGTAGRPAARPRVPRRRGGGPWASADSADVKRVRLVCGGTGDVGEGGAFCIVSRRRSWIP